jgi:hypothetical protein
MRTDDYILSIKPCLRKLWLTFSSFIFYQEFDRTQVKDKSLLPDQDQSDLESFPKLRFVISLRPVQVSFKKFLILGSTFLFLVRHIK